MLTATSARLLAPEQFIKHIQAQFGLDLARPFKGRSSALQRYLLPLGGLDHDTVYERDRQIKVQNLLAAQAIAWEAAVRIMEQEEHPQQAKIFTAAHPASITTDQADWTRRLQDFFLRIQSRPPTPVEINFFDQKFRQLLERKANPVQAWTAIVYTLLASVEFWSL